MIRGHGYCLWGRGLHSERSMGISIKSLSKSPPTLRFSHSRREKRKLRKKLRDGGRQPSLFPSFSPFLLCAVGFTDGHHWPLKHLCANYKMESNGIHAGLLQYHSCRGHQRWQCLHGSHKKDLLQECLGGTVG